MEYIILSILIIIAAIIFYILLFKCNLSKKDINRINKEKILLIRHRILV